MHRLIYLRPWLLAVVVFLPLWNATPETPSQKPSAEPVVRGIQGIPASEGRRILAADESGTAYLLDSSAQRVFQLDELTGDARLHSELEAERPIAGVLRAAVGDNGQVWVLQHAPHHVRVFENGKEREIEQPGTMINGVAVVRGRPTLALGTARPVVGTDMGKGERPPKPALVVQLDADGEWQPWIDRGERDYRTRGEVRTFGLLGGETRLAGDAQGRLLMARRYLYEVREYAPNGKLADRMVAGEAETEPLPEEAANELKAMGRTVSRNRQRPKPAIESVDWSPEGEALILATSKDGYTLDRWVPALQGHYRLPMEPLAKASNLQMVSTRNGLLFLPSMDSTKLLFVSWDYLRDAEWESLQEEAPTADSEPESKGTENS